MSETRIDPTAMGLLFIGFITLVVGLFGIDKYNELGGSTADPMIASGVFAVALFGGLALVLIAFYAYKAGSNFGASLFGWIALSLLFVAAYGGAFAGLFNLDLSDSWFLWIVIAIFYLIFAIWAFLAGTPKMLLAILVITAMVFLFLGLALNADTADSMKTMFLIMGIFGILDFLLATYLGLALTEECAKCGKFKIF
ncbi:MAG: hypothetical protein PHG93_00475 [Candidatus Methanomethylophilaceae archaeon]|nr:hypothetical protein [Candidatus Methanomethylophilaceae archaeon]